MKNMLYGRKKMKIKICFPDGSVKKYDKEVTPLKIAEDISPNLALRVIVAMVNDKYVDVNHSITEDSSLVLLDFSSEIGKEVYWHSTAHLMAQAVKELFPEVKVAIGPAIEEGFYYDFDRDQNFTEEELIQIENKMMEISKEIAVKL